MLTFIISLFLMLYTKGLIYTGEYLKTKKLKLKLILTLLIAFFLMNALVYYFSEENKNQRIEMALVDNMNDLQTHYEVLIHNQRVNADAVAISTEMTPKFIKIMKAVQTASGKEKSDLRKELYKLLTPKYRLLKTKGVLQYHFVLPNNESFLRMHKPDKFGDDLTNVRADFKYVNETKKPIYGFTQGRTAHGFRNTYPIFDKDKNYLGAMEISYSSDSFQEYLTHISKIHTHFIVDKTIFTAKAWQRDDLILKYVQSSEHENFMLTINQEHSEEKCIVKNALVFADNGDEINRGVKKGDSFSTYAVIDFEKVVVASYFPIKNLTKTKTLAWIVSYEDSPFIYNSLKSAYVTRTVAFFMLSLLVFLLYRLKLNEYMIQDQADTDGLTGVYNRKKFDKILSYELSRNARYQNNLCVAILDIDFFKKFNDDYGHLIGDEVLIMLSEHISTSIRGTDTFARWGGEEFVLLFPQTSLNQAVVICDKLRLGVQNNPHHSAGTITASFGITAYVNKDTTDSIFKRCDDALYLAKANGRNIVCTK